MTNKRYKISHMFCISSIRITEIGCPSELFVRFNEKKYLSL